MKYSPSQKSRYLNVAFITLFMLLGYIGYSKPVRSLSIPDPGTSFQKYIIAQKDTLPIKKTTRSTNAASTDKTFAVIGDYGKAGTNEAAVAALVKSWNPDFIITLGDNNYELGESSTIDANIGQYYHDFIYPYSGSYGAGADSNRFFPSLGNHDWSTASATPYKQYFTLPGNERYYDYVKGNIHFFAIDSDPHEPDGVDSNSIQALWLKNKLQISTSEWNVVYFHHSPYCSDAAHGSQSYMKWPFKRWGADVIMSSHSHVYERLLVDSLPYFVDGLGGKNIVAFDPAPLPETKFRYNSDFGAMLCNEYSDTLTFRFYNKGGTLIDSYFLTKNKPVISVVVSSPPDNSTFTFGAPITINATVTGGAGGIIKVDFFSGTIKLGTDPVYPYSFSWTNAQPGNYSVTARVTDSANNTATSAPVHIAVYAICSASGHITRDFWANITGTSVSAVPVNTAPTSTSQLTIFEGPSGIADNYGSRIRGYICPPLTGNYIFWIASDDNSELWLSTNDQPINKIKIASVSGHTGSREWTKYATQQSAPKSLTAGVKYYIEAIHKEGSQGDNLAVGWQLPNSVLERPIPGIRLSPFSIPSDSIPEVNITSPPNNTNFPSPSNITITADATSNGGNITKVEFYQGTTKIGEDITAPYSFTWMNVSSGNYALKAKATDNNNHTGTSPIVNITVAACSSPLITPLGPTTMCSGSVILQSSTGSGYTYQWKKDGNFINGATNSSYTASASGNYQVKIIQGSCIAWSALTTVKIISGLRAVITPGGPTTFCSGGSVKLFANTCSGFTYQWKKDGSYIPGATAATYIATTAGKYQLKVTQSGSSVWSSLLTVTVNACIGPEINQNEGTDHVQTVPDLSDSINSFQMKVYPNPNTGLFTMVLNMKLIKEEKVKMRIVNMLGQEIYNKEFFANVEYMQEYVELDGSLPTGIYTLQVIIGNKVENTSVVLSR